MLHMLIHFYLRYLTYNDGVIETIHLASAISNTLSGIFFLTDIVALQLGIILHIFVICAGCVVVYIYFINYINNIPVGWVIRNITDNYDVHISSLHLNQSWECSHSQSLYLRSQYCHLVGLCLG